jgi:hypothetical protein
MNAVHALTAALDAGVRATRDGNDLVLEASASPPVAVLDFLSRHKTDSVGLLTHTGIHGAPIARANRLAALSAPVLQGQPARQRRSEMAITQRLRVVARPQRAGWSDDTVVPPDGCIFTCCKSQQWWRERDVSKGWCCWTCHPPDHLPRNGFIGVTT